MEQNKVQTTGESKDKLIFLSGHTEKIKETVENVKKEFLYIGFLLWEVRHYKWYELKGYKDIVEYAEKELGFKKSSTYNFIKVCEKFSEYKDGRPTLFMDDEYKDYSFTQLCEVLPMDKKDIRENITPDMSTRQIREKKKELNNTIEITDKETGEVMTEEEFRDRMIVSDCKECGIQSEIEDFNINEDEGNYKELEQKYKDLLDFIFRNLISSEYFKSLQEKFLETKLRKNNFYNGDLIDAIVEINEKLNID